MAKDKVTADATGKKPYASFSDDELVAERVRNMEEVRILELKNTEMETQLKRNKALIKEHSGIVSDMDKEIKSRGIYDFKSRMRKKYGKGITQKQFDVMYQMAWDRGHSSGESEVENELIDLKELVDTF